MSERTFVLKDHRMRGEDVKSWERTVKQLFADMGIKCPIEADGIYDVEDRSFTASLARAMGMEATTVMAEGITPGLRTRMRGKHLTAAEKRAFNDRVDYRRKLRDRWNDHGYDPGVAVPVRRILSHAWGYHPGVHDGVDIITKADPVIFAVVKSKVIDVRASGWWGKGAPSNPAVASKGDGIIQLEVLKDVGPFRKGMHIGYGHAEKARVHEGQVVEAGTPIGHAGLANAWHIHWMINDGSTNKGIGNIDPERFLNYCIKHG